MRQRLHDGAGALSGARRRTRNIFVLSRVGSFEIPAPCFRNAVPPARNVFREQPDRQSKPPFVMGHVFSAARHFCRASSMTPGNTSSKRSPSMSEDRMPYRGKQILYVQDQKSTGLSYLALTLTLLGHLDSGLRAAEDSLRHSQSLGGPHTINFSLCFWPPCSTSAAIREGTAARDRIPGVGAGTRIRHLDRDLADDPRCVSGRRWQREQGLEAIQAGMKAHAAWRPLPTSRLAFRC